MLSTEQLFENVCAIGWQTASFHYFTQISHVVSFLKGYCNSLGFKAFYLPFLACSFFSTTVFVSGLFFKYSWYVSFQEDDKEDLAFLRTQQKLCRYLQGTLVVSRSPYQIIARKWENRFLKLEKWNNCLDWGRRIMWKFVLLNRELNNHSFLHILHSAIPNDPASQCCHSLRW